MNHKRKSDYFKRYGKFHFLLCFILQSWILISSYILIVFTFHKRLPEATCTSKLNPKEPSSLCDKTKFCDTINYDRKIQYDKSLNNWSLKYELFCENEKYLDYLSSFTFFCVVSSGLIFSPITDFIGRLFPIKLEIFFILTGFVILYFCESILFLYIGVGLFFFGNHISSLASVYFKELLEQKIYGVNVALQNIIYCIFAFGVSYYINTYNEIDYLFSAIIWFSVLMVMLSYLILMESPCWLEENSREKNNNYSTLIENYKFILNFNIKEKERHDLLATFQERVDLDIARQEYEERLCLDDYEGKCGKDKKVSIMDNIWTVFLEKENRKNFLVSSYLWFMGQTLFYMIILNLDTIQDKIPYSIYVFYIADILSNLVTVVVSHLYGRKFSLRYGSILTSISCIILYFIFDNKAGLYGTVIFFFFSFFACLSGNTVYLYVQELFETNVVATASSYSKLPSKFFLIIIPLIVECNDKLFLIFGIITAVVPLLLIFTKETRLFDKTN